jgi:hypothetical protein
MNMKFDEYISVGVDVTVLQKKLNLVSLCPETQAEMALFVCICDSIGKLFCDI